MHATPSTRRRVTSLVLAATLICLAPGFAAAQGGFLKKAKEKVVGKPEEKVLGTPEQNGPAPKFTDNLLELTNERIDACLRGIAAGQKVRGASGLSIFELNRRAETAYQKRLELLNNKDDELQAYNEADSKYDDCVRDQLHAMQKENEKAMQAKMMGGNNMALIQKISKASAQVSERFAAGDTAGALKAQSALLKLYGIDPDADTLKARAKCAPAPVKPKWMTEAEAQLKLGNDSMAEARSIEIKVREEGAARSGLTPTQFGLANERILAFINAEGKPGSSWKFSGDERGALKQRMDEIRKVYLGK